MVNDQSEFDAMRKAAEKFLQLLALPDPNFPTWANALRVARLELLAAIDGVPKPKAPP